MSESRQYDIPKRAVIDAYRRVRANKGSAGIDGVDFEKFEEKLNNNLYKIWNRMSSGSYFPSSVMAVEIPKKSGGTRRLGIPTITDRVAQMVARMYVEQAVEPMFCEDSYGYRPNKSALDAVEMTRKRCWKYDYVIELDVKGLFDNIDHELLMRVVRRHVKQSWICIYIERWLKTPFVQRDGQVIDRTSGTPQGGVISLVLANMFLHYVFDMWMKRNFPQAPFERYADDGVIHCGTKEEALYIKEKLAERFAECKLELHPVKTRIVYCKDKDRTKKEELTEFDFLGYTFKAVYIKCRDGMMRYNFIASVSKTAAKNFREKIKLLEIHKKTGCKIDNIAEILNPMIRGWMNYFGKFNPSAMKYTLQCIERRIVKWAMCKYKRFRGHRRRAERWLSVIRKREPKLFAHWSRMYSYC
ncbi:MAG TPA: group II intron reverse transcriptase/maturase [Lachnospiraceae bacterium]|nr:group II intron reverse transcriptase/maturase [Lachnospiraceae bacterium]